MNWCEIKNKLYYTNDDYLRDVILFLLQNKTWESIYEYIS